MWLQCSVVGLLDEPRFVGSQVSKARPGAPGFVGGAKDDTGVSPLRCASVEMTDYRGNREVGGTASCWGLCA